jgi:hypothetical protein
MDQLKKQQEMDEFKKSIEVLNLEDLQAKEQEIIKEADDLNKEISEYQFKISSKGYKEAAEAIRYFLEKQEVQWQYTVGLITMYEFWNPTKNPKQVSYPMFDGTVRTLGEMKFKGYKEWKYVVEINEYFKDVRDEYAELTEKIWDNATKHNIILERLELLDPSKANKPDTV